MHAGLAHVESNLAKLPDDENLEIIGRHRGQVAHDGILPSLDALCFPGHPAGAQRAGERERMSETSAGVEIRQLHKRFKGGDHDAVDGVDLSIREGELLVLLGPSGCGKTTLLRMIAGLEHPTSGEIYIGGTRMDGDVPPRARGIAMVFQSYALYPHRTVFGNIAFPLEAAGQPRATIAQKVRWAADMFGITRYLDRYPRQLSGGERQRVALCRALVRDPQVFLLDEPLANLDAKLRNMARDELKRFQRQVKRTVVYVTHDQVEAMGLGDRIVVMDRGKVRQVGTPHEVYEDPVDTFVATFLGQPPMNLVDVQGALLGFRPEHFLPVAHFGANDALRTFPLSVRRVEYLGSDRYVYGSVGGAGATVSAKLPATVATEIAEGNDMEFAVPERALCYFDAATGARQRR